MMGKHNQFYILDAETKQVVQADLATWSRWLESAERKVAETILGGGVFVSTAFLGMAYTFEAGEPLLFATIVTGGAMSGYANHYATWDEALAGHHEMVGVVVLAEATDAIN